MRHRKQNHLPAALFADGHNNIFETPGDGEDLTIAGNDNEVDHNTFQNKNAMGRFLAITWHRKPDCRTALDPP